MSVCTDFLTLELTAGTGSRTAESEPARNWLVQAKADFLIVNKNVAVANGCGLVDTTETGAKAVLDEVRVFKEEEIALSAVVKKRAGNPTIALRCTSQVDGADVDTMIPLDVDMTALEVGAVTGR